MKISVNCNSILLQKSISCFVKPYLTSVKHCDFLICDGEKEFEKPLFIIGKDIKKPFTKEELILALEDFSQNKSLKEKKSLKPKDFLEEKVEDLVYNFSKDLIELIKNHYEK